MTTVGIVGGLGPESTIDYYRRILEAWRREAPASSPSVVIDSLDVATGLRLAEHDHPALTRYLLASIQRLAAAGADFVAMAANTAHVVFDELAAESPVQLVSIVEVCAREAQRRGLRRLALLGTRFTMEGAFYPGTFARHGITIVSPDGAERTWLHERYVGELLQNTFRDETRDGVLGIVRRLRDADQVDGVILGGTELPLLLRADVVEGLPALDTTVLHVEDIVRRLREGARADAAPQPARHEPTQGLQGWITHTDLASTDPEATRAWCAGVLGWSFQPPFPTPNGNVHLFTYSDKGGGAVRRINPPEVPGSIPYVHVADAATAYHQALAAGAEAMMSPTRVMEGVTIAIVRAPGGVPVGFSGP